MFQATEPQADRAARLPALLVFDVNETLSDMAPLVARFEEVGAPRTSSGSVIHASRGFGRLEQRQEHDVVGRAAAAHGSAHEQVEALSSASAAARANRAAGAVSGSLIRI